MLVPVSQRQPLTRPLQSMSAPWPLYEASMDSRAVPPSSFCIQHHRDIQKHFLARIACTGSQYIYSHTGPSMKYWRNTVYLCN